MTGFGRAECQEGDYTYQAEIRSVNNRFIEINTRLPKAYVDLEQPLKKLIKVHCSRGSISLSISLGNSNEGSGEWDVKPNLLLATKYVDALKQIQDKLIYEAVDSQSKRSGKFGHLYAELKVSQISKSWVLKRNAFEIPEDILLEAEMGKITD